MSNQVVHFELMGPDAAQIQGFYKDQFGWDAQEYPGMDGYGMVDAEQSGIGGGIGKGPDEMPNYHLFYVQVDSIDAQLAKVDAGGGKTVVPKTTIPGTVTFAVFADPVGNMVGIVEAETPAA